MEILPPTDQIQIEPHALPLQRNGSAVHRRGNVKNEETLERVVNGTCSSEPKVHSVWNNILFGPGRVPLWDWRALQIVVAFTALQGVLYYLPFGNVVEGKVGHDGKRIRYSLNGLHALAVTVLLLVGLWYCGMFQGPTVSGRVLQLVVACTALSLLAATVLYLHSLSADSRQLVNYGDGGNFLQEFALGRIIDPSVGRIDLKQFCMVRIGFIGWAQVDLCYLLTEIEMRGAPSLPLLLVVTFQLIYILDFLIDEESVLPTKEYTEDGIGFLMIFGEYMWVPVFYSLPVHFLLHRPTYIFPLTTTIICLLFGIGFLVYHLSNAQKFRFRKNPSDPAVAHLETLPSPSGKNLLVSGWFGRVRHPNYLGDILMVLAWCLPCGVTSLLPYLPFLQCTNLLRQRANELEEACREKHGTAWQEYCRRVPHKFVPHVY
ncbi:delta(14)-sterol reductase TM7SF2-like [Megalops cyprinoides]|uniref:delta(14)-sterol reductase TM7SF2-like n=1 Tax=Megalops cyprinoides TaxID=118141 RepID=UPI00186544A1|nr:delta(14)-sterol reductase TM7SF2-like [Megalops cyprinoides]